MCYVPTLDTHTQVGQNPADASLQPDCGPGCLGRSPPVIWSRKWIDGQIAPVTGGSGPGGPTGLCCEKVTPAGWGGRAGRGGESERRQPLFLP